jgi:hypothetical protein
MRGITALFCFLGGVLLGAAELGATPLHLAFDREGEGLALAQAGIGLFKLRSGPVDLTINVGGPIALAWLYWAGHDRPCLVDSVSDVCEISQVPFKDQVLRLDGHGITGQVLGTEFDPVTSRGPILHIAYGADVTAQVQAKGTGRLTFRVADGDLDSNLADLDGAGLLVLYTDPNGPRARVLGFQGADYAYGESFSSGETTITEAVTFPHGATKASRRGEMVLFVAGAGKDRRPDRIEIRGNPARIDQLDSSSGAEWDADRIPVDVPGRNVATTVQIFSEPWGRTPDSLLWVGAALWLPLPAPQGCSADVWNGRPEWTGTGVAPGQLVRNVFSQSSRYGQIGNVSLRTALRFQGGSGLLGAAKLLIREGTAALLNATSLTLEYPYTRSQIIVLVDGALFSGDLTRLDEVTSLLQEANEAGCP